MRVVILLAIVAALAGCPNAPPAQAGDANGGQVTVRRVAILEAELSAVKVKAVALAARVEALEKRAGERKTFIGR